MKFSDYSETINRCSQCNFCQAFCPSYMGERTENYLARHRLNMIRDVLVTRVSPDNERFREILDKCLLCTSCTRDCSGMVPVDEIIITARNELLKREKGLGAIRRGFMSKLLKEKGLRSVAGVAGNIAGKLGLSKNMPQISSNPFDSKYSGTVKAEGTVRGRVAYFAGCGSNFLFPEVGTAVVKVLAANGIETVIPGTLTCCGVPMISEGDIDAAADMMRRNIDELSAIDAEAVVMDCSSCRMMFMKKAPKLFEKDDPVQEKISALCARIKEPSAYLVSKGITHRSSGSMKSFTMHIPCHSDRSVEKNLIDMMKGGAASYHAMEYPERCCGAGGTFYMNNEEMSGRIRKNKLEDIMATGADAVVTECPMCRYYIKSGLPDKEVLHPMEFMARNL